MENRTMTDALALAFLLAALAGLALPGVRSPGPVKNGGHSASGRPGRPSLWVCLLLVMTLSACGSSSSPGTSARPDTAPGAKTAVTSPAATPSTPPTSSADWTTYHANNERTGYIAGAPDPQSLSKIWSAQLDGSVYAEPLVVGDHVIVATEGDSLYALDPATGSVQWHTGVGSPVPLSSLPCGNIDPLGITGTPVYDPATGLVFAVAEIGGPAHILVGVDVATGQVKVRRLADAAGMDPRAHQQRAALALANGMVYIAYGGLDGDCSDYIGRVVASRTDGLGPLLVYRVPTPREGGIWAPPGPSVDAVGNLYVAVGNGAVTGGQWDYSDSILKLSPTLQLQDAFAPSNWGDENAHDEDLGSQGPVLLPGNLVFAAGKSGNGYILNGNRLGGIGSFIDEQGVCHSFGGAAAVGSTIFVPCTDGVRQITVDANGHMHLGWGASGGIAGSPVVGGHTLYSLSRGTIYALAVDSGQLVTSLQVGQTSRFATPTISGSSIFIGTLAGITAVGIA
jgi:outer membrane protein assembly factor BamB